MVYLLAGTYSEAANYAHREHISNSQWRFIHDPQMLMGQRGITIRRIGHWKHHPRLEEIELLAASYEIKFEDAK